MVRIKKHGWVEGFPGPITVCNSRGIILEMNEKAIESFRAEGGKKLIGSNLMDCHPEPALSKLKRMMRKRQSNVYTVTKGRTRKIVLETPWYEKNEYRGFVEIELPLTSRIHNLIRKS